ncbi:DNA polymerase III subunit beta [Candidatus Falkowbacteria bacterium CG10_big_fil_rev_8_21_14_0_10_39_9]|uniref:Beta sliding clamp n=1 Tax=Candidatus Falkowbacteria bacterium CG10_big_fil_rev_8_21_14_0_10_39_9 TaxID=1974566 RepID=A0A2M6WP91_9BACT|nr:MAG: DNA polymerase III subunit beta [Candidatus Falkowbacteria bacterium CG10_big_fil_rev_8_21_14_0_10_39_9]
MTFISLQENLKQGLAIVSRIVSKNINLPILNNILFKVNKSNIELIATNLEIGITHQVRGKIDSEGEFTVDSKIITDYINLLPGDKVECEQDGSEIKIKCQNYKTKINIQDASDFPLIPKVNKDSFYSVPIDDLRSALSEVIFAVANNETRLELSGVLWLFTGDSLILVGTDSYRLAEKKIKIKSNYESPINKVIVPARTLQELIRVLSSFKDDEQLENAGEIKICLSDNQILFIFGSTELVSRLINGGYPDYQQIIPLNYKTRALINKNELMRAIKASAIFSKAGVNDVALDFKSETGKITISSASSQVGESSVELNSEIEGDNNEIIINYRYFLDGLNNISSDIIRLDLVNSGTPCVLRPEKTDDYLYIVMPIRQ